MIFSELLLNLKANHKDEVGDSIKQAGLLLEGRDSNNNTNPLLDEELARCQINDQETKELIDALLNVASLVGGSQSAAIWALGKSGCSDVVKRITYIAKDLTNDDVVYQSLVAAEDCDINQAWEFIEQTAHSSLPKSKEFALRKLELKSMGIYDEQ